MDRDFPKDTLSVLIPQICHGNRSVSGGGVKGSFSYFAIVDFDGARQIPRWLRLLLTEFRPLEMSRIESQLENRQDTMLTIWLQCYIVGNSLP